MIIRIFTATIPIELHNEFEVKFRAISLPLVNGYPGLISCDIGKPSKWNPNEFVMVSQWESEFDLINFAGEKWNEAHIPQGMDQYIQDCSVSHFESL